MKKLNPKKDPAKVVIRRETIRRLTGFDLASVIGGVPVMDETSGCAALDVASAITQR